MSQERLDQTCGIELGTRDAIHVPFIVGQFDYKSVSLQDKIKLDFRLKPGSWVKFTDKEFTKFNVCEKEEAHGILNPFLDEISLFDNVVVMLIPGITNPVRHTFEINTERKKIERESLEADLERIKKEDSDCAECWYIKNNEIVRG